MNEKLKVLDYVRRCIKRNQDARKPLEYRWYENAAFAAGYTNIEYDPRSQRPIAFNSSAIESSNPQVQDKLRKYHAKLVSPRMMPECVPGSNERDSRKKATVANSLILHFWDKRDTIYAKHAAMMNMMIFGNGIWATQWDPNAGEFVEEIAYSDGMPEYDSYDVPLVDEFNNPSLVDMPFMEERILKTVSYQTGLPKIRSVHPFNFFPDPHWRHLNISQCMNYAERKLIPYDLMEIYFPDIDMGTLKPISEPEDAFLFREVDSTFGLRESYKAGQKMVEVWDFYHAPIYSKSLGLDYRSGFRCVYTGDQIIKLIDGLPYNDYPHTTYRDRQFTDRGWGLCVVDVLRQAQKRLDLVEHIEIRAAERTADPPMLKPAGSNDTNFQGRAGEIYEYVPYGEEKPSFMVPPQISPHLFQMRQDAMADLESLSLTSSPVGGSAPSRGDSAAYLDRLLEENQVAMAPTVQEIEASQAHQATHLVRLCQDHLPIGYRFALMGADQQAAVHIFDGTPFNLLDVRMVPGSAAVSYPNQIRSSIMQLASNGLLQESNPRTDAIVELLLGAPVAARLTDIEEPGDKAVASINILRIADGQEPFFRPWMNHQKHIGVLLEAMRDPKFFLDYSPEQQQKLEQLLAQHQAAIAPNQAPQGMPGMPGAPGAPGAPGQAPPAPPQGGGPEELAALLGGDMKGPAMAPAVASGFTGELGVEGNAPN
tara:strand:- start:1537 stop:3660 length:2124 start_codon:yes stop_codon:yes gene_type:complete